MLYFASILLIITSQALGFSPSMRFRVNGLVSNSYRTSSLQMNFFDDALRFFSNMNKEASAKHILIKGANAEAKCLALKEELVGSDNLSNAFSELAARESECPSGRRGGNLGTFKPGTLLQSYNDICFETF